MKRLIKLLVLFVAVGSMAAMTSCTKDKESSIVGKWQYVNATVDINIDDPELQQMLDWFIQAIQQNLDEENNGLILEFKSDNTVVSTYTYDGETTTETDQYSVNGDKLTVGTGELTEEMTIETLTSSKLVITSNESYDEDGISFTAKVTMEFKRI